jgi:hypothetical protein
MERFFGAIKPWLKPFVIHAACALQAVLIEAQSFYNHVRPHQNLNGMTPVEAWTGLTPADFKQTQSATAVQALDGEGVGITLGFEFNGACHEFKKPLSALWGLEGGLVVCNRWNLTSGLAFGLRNLIADV